MSRGRRRGLQKASSRAQRGGGTERPLSVPMAPPGNSQEWFGPGRPLPPVAPPSVAGRRFDFQFGTNYNVRPRQTERFTFEALRQLADTHDLTRLAIETCKDRMIRLKWGFRVLDSDEDLSEEQQARADRLRKLLRRPDGRNFWVDWLRMVLEDLLVIDAPSIFVRRTIDETELVGLIQIDGATIKPIIDQHGNEPEPPEAAYQQVLHGVPAANYTREQLVYAPRNRRVHHVYGFSPVEQIVATINIALRRQVWQHSYFTSGNIPDALIGVPSTWTPDQIRDFQDWFDSILTGNTERRRNGIFVPGEVAKSYVPTKDAEMFGAAEEWLARVVCFCFGIPHQALVKEVNRATADNAYEQAIEDGLAPVMAWVKSLLDRILIDVLGEEELEFWWVKDEAIDPKVQDEIWKGRIEAGSHTRNEWRVAVGDQPREEPEADRLLYMGKPLGVEDQIADQQTRMDSGVFPEAIPGNGKRESSDGVVASGGKDGAEEDEEASKAASSTTTREGEHRRPFGRDEAGGKFSEDGDGLVFEKKYSGSQPRHPAGSSKGGQFASTHATPGAAVATASGKKPKVSVHQNKDGSHTVYVNGKKDFKGTKEQAEHHVVETLGIKPAKPLHSETMTVEGKSVGIKEKAGGTFVVTSPGGVELSTHTSLDAAKEHATSMLKPAPLPAKQKVAGKKIEIHQNKNGSHTVYVNGKKEFKGTKEEADAHVKATHLKPPTPSPATTTGLSAKHTYGGKDYQISKSGYNQEIYHNGTKIGTASTYAGAIAAAEQHALGGPPKGGTVSTHSINGKTYQVGHTSSGQHLAAQGSTDLGAHTTNQAAIQAAVTHSAGGASAAPKPKASPAPAPASTKPAHLTDVAVGEHAHAVAAKRPSLSPTEKAAMTTYTGGSYQEINNSLRKGFTSKSHADTIRGMDSAFKKAKTTEDIVVYRGLKQNLLSGMSKGAVFTDKGFTSTSTSPMKAQNFGTTVMKINVPKGSPAMTVKSISHYPQEHEIVIKRGGRYRVRGVEQHVLDNGATMTVIGVDYVG